MTRLHTGCEKTEARKQGRWLARSPGPGAHGEDFQDFVNHELRTPLTAAGTALQTLALHMERTGGRPHELLEIALRNLRRLEQTVDWAADVFGERGELPALGEPSVLPVADLVCDLDDVVAGSDVTWATDAGDWQAEVVVDRPAWRRLLRQVVRALASHAGSDGLHLDLRLVPELDGDDTCGLMLVGNLPLGDPAASFCGSCGEDDDAEQLQRLLAFMVRPELAERLSLRADVVRLTGRLRLRLLLPLPCAAADLVTS